MSGKGVVNRRSDHGPTEVTVSRGDESGTNMNTACHIIWLLPSVAASPGIPSLSRRFLSSSVPYSHILDLEVKAGRFQSLSHLQEACGIKIHQSLALS